MGHTTTTWRVIFRMSTQQLVISLDRRRGEERRGEEKRGEERRGEKS